MSMFDLTSLFKRQEYTLCCPEFSNFRRERGMNLADVTMRPISVSQAEYKKLNKLGCCDIGSHISTMNESEVENLNDRLSRFTQENGSTKYTEAVSKSLFNASVRMQGVQRGLDSVSSGPALQTL